jgi:hypothetical protein
MNITFGLLCAMLAAPPPVPAPTPPQAEDDSILLGRATRLRWATPQIGRALLTADDDFSKNLSRYDLQCRLQTDQPVSLDDWRRFVANQVRDWSWEDQRRVREAWAALNERLKPYDLPLPGEIWLVRTTGNEENHAAYTRGRAIVLPAKVMAYAPLPLQRLLAHELFHILSRHDPALRGRLYRVIGFEVCAPIEFPASLATRKITNPDAPLVDCTIKLAAADGTTYIAAPILYAADPSYDAKRRPTLFQSLIFRLLVVEPRGARNEPVLRDDVGQLRAVDLQPPGGARYEPVLRDGQPVVIDPTREPAFLAQVGRNTDYLIHPDEILADNFVRLVFADPQVRTPQILEQMRHILAAEKK